MTQPRLSRLLALVSDSADISAACAHIQDARRAAPGRDLHPASAASIFNFQFLIFNTCMSGGKELLHLQARQAICH